MPTYAKDTEVSVSKSEMEVKATLRRYGAERMAVVEDVGHVKIIFVMNNRQVRIVLPLPRCNAEEFTINKKWGPDENKNYKWKPNASLEYSESFLNQRFGVLFGISRRAYGDAATDFLRELKAARPVAIDALSKQTLPDVQPLD